VSSWSGCCTVGAAFQQAGLRYTTAATPVSSLHVRHFHPHDPGYWLEEKLRRRSGWRPAYPWRGYICSAQAALRSGNAPEPGRRLVLVSAVFWLPRDFDRLLASAWT